MSARSLLSYALDCDGCDASFGVLGEHSTAMELRAAAHSAGWRFPARVKANGQLTSGTAPGTTSDVCPSCIDGWKRQPARDGRDSKRRRP